MAMNSLENVWKDVKGSPALLVGGAFAIIAVLFIVYKSNSSNSTQGNTTSQQTQGPYYVAFLPDNGNTNSNGQQTAVNPPSPALNPKPVNPQTTLTIRAKNNNQTWDQQHTGVPVDSSPGGSVSYLLPFGSQVNYTNIVQGPSDFGNTSWYQVSYNGVVGYVNGYDVQSFSTTGNSLLFTQNAHSPT